MGDKESNAENAADAYNSDGVNNAERLAQISTRTRVKFLSRAVGVQWYANGSGPQGGAADPALLNDQEPKNESQIERKRRLNRNNERKKRAKRIMKIEDLTANFHALTSKNKELKAESNQLKESILAVQQYMSERGIVLAPTVELAQSSPCCSGSSSQLTINSLVSSGIHTSRNDACRIVDASLQAQRASFDMVEHTRSLTSPQANPHMTAAITDRVLGLLPRELRMHLLRLEFEKQERIIAELRIHLGTTMPVGERQNSHALPVQALAAPTSPNPIISLQTNATLPSSWSHAPSFFTAASSTPAQNQVDATRRSSPES